MRKIHVVGIMKNYANWMEGELVDSIEEADLVVFTGGADITPAFYYENKHPLTSNDLARDQAEVNAYRHALSLGKKLWGTCRGSQLLCVMAGGRLVQHQQNPGYYHEMITYDGHEIRCNSTHHQAQFPFNLSDDKYKILAWTEGISKFHEDGNRQEMSPPKEVEICFYPKIKALCCQGHPEIMAYSDFQSYCKELLDKHMNNEL